MPMGYRWIADLKEYILELMIDEPALCISGGGVGDSVFGDLRILRVGTTRHGGTPVGHRRDLGESVMMTIKTWN